MYCRCVQPAVRHVKSWSQCKGACFILCFEIGGFCRRKRSRSSIWTEDASIHAKDCVAALSFLALYYGNVATPAFNNSQKQLKKTLCLAFLTKLLKI